MDFRDETLIRVTGEQVILRLAVKWLLAREAKRSGEIDATLRVASEAIGNAITDIPETYRGTVQQNLDQLIAEARIEALAQKER
jgi:hypothetical protein